MRQGLTVTMYTLIISSFSQQEDIDSYTHTGEFSMKEPGPYMPRKATVRAPFPLLLAPGVPVSKLVSIEGI